MNKLFGFVGLLILLAFSACSDNNDLGFSQATAESVDTKERLVYTAWDGVKFYRFGENNQIRIKNTMNDSSSGEYIVIRGTIYSNYGAERTRFVKRIYCGKTVDISDYPKVYYIENKNGGIIDFVRTSWLKKK